MPLDPFFDERLRVHRKYLFDQALGTMRARLATLGRFWRDARAAGAGGRGIRRRRRPRAPPRRARARGRAPALATAAPRWRGTAASSTRHRHARARGPHRRAPRGGRRAPRRPGAHLLPRRRGGAPVPARPGVLRRRLPHRRHRLSDDGCRLPAPHRRRPCRDRGRRLRARPRASLSGAGRAGVRGARVAVRAGGGARRGSRAASASSASRPAATSPPRSTLINRDRANFPLRLQVLEVPVVDLTGGHLDLSATRASASLALSPCASCARWRAPTCRARRTRLEPYASPLRAASHEGLPPAVDPHRRVRPAPRRRRRVRACAARAPASTRAWCATRA